MESSATNGGKATAWPVPEWAKNHAAWLRLEDQIQWYGAKSARAQRWYKSFKFVQILLAVLIPVSPICLPSGGNGSPRLPVR